MKLFKLLFVVLSFLPLAGNGQFQFDGYVDKTNWPEEVYLSLIEDYRKISGIYPEQIIQKVIPDSLGYFVFNGDYLPEGNHIYKIQTHNCSETEDTNIHFNGFCPKSKEILFIANQTDTISLPFSFDQEMFCKVLSTNQSSDAFIKIDSLIHEMQYTIGNYSGETSRKLNSVKWLKTLQQYARQQKEPLLELYIYSFVSNKANELYNYYLEDLKDNPYYDELLGRLQEKYLESSYTNQYNAELSSDKFLVNPEKPSLKISWIILLVLLLLVSVIINIVQFQRYRKKSAVFLHSNQQKLTVQEQKILDLILEDKTNKEIATAMYVSISTVKTHINNLYKKLNVASREEVKSLFINN